MCFYLYAALQGDISENEYQVIQNNSEYRIALGTKHDIKNAIKSDGALDEYRITDWVCDCESPIGNHDPSDPMIQQISDLITNLSTIEGAIQINICKTWTGKTNKKEVKLQLKDLDLPLFLADMTENCLYSIEI